MWPRVLRFVVALVVAAIAWYNLSPLYNRFLAAAATPLLKIDRRFRGATVVATGRIIRVAGSVPSADIPASELTYNIIFLAALFASNRRPLRDRNMVGFFASCGVLVILHIIAVFLATEAGYAAHMGDYSERHYGRFAYFFWVYTEAFYRLVGMFSAVFACWWLAGAGQDKSR